MTCSLIGKRITRAVEIISRQMPTCVAIFALELPYLFFWLPLDATFLFSNGDVLSAGSLVLVFMLWIC
jgi:hypothetical protein